MDVGKTICESSETNLQEWVAGLPEDQRNKMAKALGPSAGTPCRLLSRRDLLSNRLAEVESLLKSAEESAALEESTDVEIERVLPCGKVSVVIGTSKLAAEHPGLAETLTTMINASYDAVEGKSRMLEMQPVSERLKMGDGCDARGDGVLATNRVLHVAFCDGVPVGCVSSSFSTVWLAIAGHWGLLVVDTKMQGKGIASVLSDAAERRIAGRSPMMQLEYDFIPGKDHCLHLEAMYAKKGYKQIMSFPNGPNGSEFRIVMKELTELAQTQGQRRDLLAEKAQITALVSQSPSEEDSVMQTQGLVAALSAYIATKGEEETTKIEKVFQLIVTDAGEEGKIVVDLKNGNGSVRTGQDPKADITVLMADKDMVAWWKQSLQWEAAFWSGQVTMTCPHRPSGPGGRDTWWAGSVDKFVALLAKC